MYTTDTDNGLDPETTPNIDASQLIANVLANIGDSTNTIMSTEKLHELSTKISINDLIAIKRGDNGLDLIQRESIDITPNALIMLLLARIERLEDALDKSMLVKYKK